MLALTQGDVLEFKSIITENHCDKNINCLRIKIKIKVLLYFIISTIFLLFFWYYISMFCAIYANRQIHLIKDTILSYLLSLLEPFRVYLIPGLFRVPALSKQNKIRYFLYKFSKIIQLILM